MKRLLIYICAVSIMASCNLLEFDVSSPSQIARDAVLAQFSSANIKNCNSRLGYFIVHFSLDAENDTTTDCVAWYDRDGKWYLTESSMDYKDLPQAVKTALETGEFNNCSVEKVFCLDTPNYREYAMFITGTIYGYAPNGFLYYKENGTLHISIANPRSDYTFGDYLLAPICKKRETSNTNDTTFEN